MNQIRLSAFVLGALCALLSISIMPTVAAAAPTGLSGTISSDTTWAGVHISGTVTIPAGVTVTIAPGAVVSVDPGVDIDVQGSLRALGTSDRSLPNGGEILFRSTTPSAGTPWGAIRGLPGGKVYLLHTDVGGGGQTGDPSASGGPTAEVICESCGLSMHESAVHDGVLSAVRLFGSANAVINDTVINEANGASVFQFGGASLIENSILTSDTFVVLGGTSTVQDSGLNLSVQPSWSSGSLVARSASLNINSSDVFAVTEIGAGGRLSGTNDIFYGGLWWSGEPSLNPSPDQVRQAFSFENVDAFSATGQLWRDSRPWQSAVPTGVASAFGYVTTVDPMFTRPLIDFTRAGPGGSGLPSDGRPATQQLSLGEVVSVTTDPPSPAIVGGPVTVTAHETLVGAEEARGTMVFYDSSLIDSAPSAPIGTAAITAAGTATITTASLPVGDHFLRAFAQSIDDPAYLAFDGQLVFPNFHVNPAPHLPGALIPTTLTFGRQTIGAPISTLPVILTAGGSAPLTLGGVSATGDFTATDDCPVSLPVGSSCTVEVAYAATAVGMRSGTLSFADDATDSPQTVSLSGTGQAATTTAVTSSSPSATFGQPVTVTAAVSTAPAGLGTLDGGTVTFRDGGNPIGTASLLAGVASLTTSLLGVGDHTISASYGGADLFLPSDSSGFDQVVDQATTTTTLAVANLTPLAGDGLAVSATVAPVGPGAGSPTGTVTLADDATSVGTTNLSAGTASFTLASAGAGIHHLHATYTGGPSFASSDAAELDITVGLRPTALATPPVVTAQYSDAVTVSSTLTDLTTGAGLPNQTVIFTAGGQSVAGVSGPDGVASASLTVAQPAGVVAAVAGYPGDASHSASSSSSGAITITKEDAALAYSGPTTVATSGPSASVTLAATVTQAGDGSPGDLSRAGVVFKLYRSANTAMTLPDVVVGPVAIVATAGAPSGTANAVALLAPDTYTVVVSFESSNGYYSGPDAPPTALTVYQNATGHFAVGGARFADGALGFAVRYKPGTTAAQGLLVARGRGPDGYDYLVVTTWAGGSLTFHGPGSQATVSGHCSLLAVDHATHRPIPSRTWLVSDTCRLDVTDGQHQPDTFALTVTDPVGRPVLGIGTPSAQMPVRFGDIVLG